MDRMTEQVRVLLVDDDALVRGALSLMLGGQEGVDVVGEASDGREAIDMAHELEPDVILMDIRMPVMNGLQATAELHSDPEPPRVIILTTFDADEHVVRAVAAGAEGFLLKDTPPAEILDAIQKVASGEAMLSPSATRSLIQRVRAEAAVDRSTDALERLSTLTEREHEVALCIGKGLSNADIAKELYLSIPTVKAHVSRIFDKLGTTNRVQIAICVHDAGLV